MDAIYRILVAGVIVSLTCGCSRDATTTGAMREGVTPSSAPSSAPRTNTGTGHVSRPESTRILLLHHSTGRCIWDGGVAEWFDDFNRTQGTNYRIEEREFPKSEPYGWNNYPYDYWNIWVRNAGEQPFQEEPTLELLTRDYGVIVFKHCFPVSNIELDIGRGEVTSEEKRSENYKLQYAALKDKLRRFSQTRFLLWTGAAQVERDTDIEQARRAQAFFDWVRTKWDEPGDNIFLWDFRELETEGGLYLKPEYSAGDGHPNEEFSRKVAPRFAQRVVAVIQGAGDRSGAHGTETPGGATTASPAEKQVPTPSAPAVAKSQPIAPPVGRTDVSAPNVQPAAATTGVFVFDDAESPVRSRLWPKGASYVGDPPGQVIRLNFAESRAEDWGDYGPHRIVTTTITEKDWDIRNFRFVTFRVRADRVANLTFSLVTEGDRADESYFGFAAYLQTEANSWKAVVLDLEKLELVAEGDVAYAAAGSPSRPLSLSRIKLAVHEKDARGEFAIDDIVFRSTTE